MNINELALNNQAVNAHTEQPVSSPVVDKKDLTTNFFIVGGVINIVMILSYFVWAVRAWKKSDKEDRR